MRFDRWTYKRKNRMLGVAVILIVLISWVFSFSKTYIQIREYRQLSAIHHREPDALANSGQLIQKDAKLDSLIQEFTVDSVAFEDNFLQNISLALQGVPVRISYDGSKSTDTPHDAIIRKQITLEGKYRDIVGALQKLERIYYLNRCRMLEGGRCVVEVAVVKGK